RTVLDAEAEDGAVGAPVSVLLRPAGADLLTAQALPLPEAALEEGVIGRHLEAGAAGDDPGRVHGAGERGGDDDVRRVRRDRGGERLRLLDPGLVQRDVDLALQAPLPVVVGLAMAHEHQAGARGLHSPRPSSITRSTTGASRQTRARAEQAEA